MGICCFSLKKYKYIKEITNREEVTSTKLQGTKDSYKYTGEFTKLRMEVKYGKT